MTTINTKVIKHKPHNGFNDLVKNMMSQLTNPSLSPEQRMELAFDITNLMEFTDNGSIGGGDETDQELKTLLKKLSETGNLSEEDMVKLKKLIKEKMDKKEAGAEQEETALDPADITG